MLLLTALVLVLIPFFLNNNSTVDIHVHDTYFIIWQGHVFLLLAFIVWILWMVYLLAYRVLFSKNLTWIHVITTLLTVLVLIYIMNYENFTTDPGLGRYVDFSNWNSVRFYNQGMRWAIYFTVILLFGQVILVINFILGLFKRLTFKKPQ